MYNLILKEGLFIQLQNFIKFTIYIVILLGLKYSSKLNYLSKYGINSQPGICLNYSFTSSIVNITNISNFILSIVNINYDYSKSFELIEIRYKIQLFDGNYDLIKPSDFSLMYNLHLLCDFNFYENNETKNIYSIANIEENKFFFCLEHIKINEHAKFGIIIYKIDEKNINIESYEQFFFTDKLIKNNLIPRYQNNEKFDFNLINNNYNQLLFILKNNNNISNFNDTLKYSFLKPPLSYFKKDISIYEGKWYFENIYGNYFCFCKGEYCIKIKTFYYSNYQSCIYFFYLTIIDKNKNLYTKTHYLLSDFFTEDIECSDAFPIFKEMLKKNLNAHFITVSQDIYNQFCLNNINCFSYNSPIIYGIRKINGNVVENYLELLLKLKVVITAEQYDSIDNLFYNINYITYIFLGHGVQFIKSYLYKDYLSYKRYNKILLPPYKKIVDLALEAGWKYENIIKIGLPKWDNYITFDNRIFLESDNEKNKERSIFLMFTWRNVKKGEKISESYYNNLYLILNNTYINEQLYEHNIKLYFCYHHKLKDKRKIKTTKNIIYTNQNDISILLKNSSLIITDFSAIIFDAIIQKKPLILFIPDALDSNLEEIYLTDYYETITKLKKGLIDLYEIFFDVKKVINKIIYYIKKDFALEEEKLKFYNKFQFKNKGNTIKFIKYIETL